MFIGGNVASVKWTCCEQVYWFVVRRAKSAGPDRVLDVVGIPLASAHRSTNSKLWLFHTLYILAHL